MEKKTDFYLTCPRFKGQKKHIRVCQRCRKNRSCKEYQQHIQMALPLDAALTPDPSSMPFCLVEAGPEEPERSDPLLQEIRRELLGIRALLS